MKYLKIQSVGEIEDRAFTLIGNSTKRGDSSQIGMFGSGLKYAISALLRNKIKFQVFSGNRELKFEIEREGFRNNEFDVISLNGVKTSFTCSMGGSDWDNPFAPIREIYSNALDEDADATINESLKSIGSEGTTTFFIEMTPDVKDFYENIELYFCNHNSNVLFTTPIGTVYRSVRDELRLFRKGILCHTANRFEGQFDYNSHLFKINEARVISSFGMTDYVTGAIWKLCKDKQAIYSLFKGINNESSYSYRMEWHEHWNAVNTRQSFSEVWEEVVRESRFASYESIFLFEESQLKGRIFLPHKLISELEKQFPFIDVVGMNSSKNGVVFNEVKPSKTLQNKVIDALSILYKTDYSERLVDPAIKYVKFKEESILALAEEGIIFLSTKLDVKSPSEIAKIIIEENEHNLTGHSDKTREFQNHLFDLYYNELTKTKLHEKVS